MSLFEATATAGATALNVERIICSASASFTATSTVSYEDALIKAKAGAKKVAQSEAEFTANVVSQSTEVTLGIVEKEGLVGPTGPTGPAFDLTVGFGPTGSNVGATSYSNINTIIFDSASDFSVS